VAVAAAAAAQADSSQRLPASPAAAERPEPTIHDKPAGAVPTAFFRPFYIGLSSTVTIDEVDSAAPTDDPAAAAQPEPTFNEPVVAAAQSTFHNDEPVAAAQPAPPAALAEPYYYTVDVDTRHCDGWLGMRILKTLEQHLRVLSVDEAGCIGDWNKLYAAIGAKMCQTTFPRDQVCAEDMIVSVNGRGGAQLMLTMLQTEFDFVIVMCRGGVPPPPISTSEGGAATAATAAPEMPAPSSARTAPAAAPPHSPPPSTPPHSPPSRT
jgi:hypothetical protein